MQYGTHVRADYGDQVGSVSRALRFLANKRHIIRELVRHDLRERYAAHVLGSIWHVMHPLLLATIYVMVFSFIFKTRFVQEGLTDRDYINYAFSGLIPWLTLQEGLTRGANSITGQSYLVRQAEFPLETLPVKAALSTTPTLLLLTFSALLFSVARGVAIPATVLLLPAYWVLLFSFVIGMNFILGTIAVFAPDIRDVLQVVLAIGLFLSPILYLPGQEPDWLKTVFLINPFTYVILPHKDLMFYGTILSPWFWLTLLALDAALLAVGVRVFHSLRPAFGDVL